MHLLAIVDEKLLRQHNVSVLDASCHISARLKLLAAPSNSPEHAVCDGLGFAAQSFNFQGPSGCEAPTKSTHFMANGRPQLYFRLLKTKLGLSFCKWPKGSTGLRHKQPLETFLNLGLDKLAGTGLGDCRTIVDTRDEKTSYVASA